MTKEGSACKDLEKGRCLQDRIQCTQASEIIPFEPLPLLHTDACVRITIHTRLHTYPMAPRILQFSITRDCQDCNSDRATTCCLIYLHMSTTTKLHAYCLVDESPGPSTASTLQPRHPRTHDSVVTWIVSVSMEHLRRSLSGATVFFDTQQS